MNVAAQVVVEVAMLAIFDALLSGFRAAAGRDGRILKTSFYGVALARGAAAGVLVVAANAMIVRGLVASAPAPSLTWQAVVEAGARSVSVFRFVALFAGFTIGAWFSPARELRILPTLLALGPLTLVRPLVIGGGLLYAVWPAVEWRVWAVALAAGASMLGIEWLLGVRYRNRWRRLV